eukprot:NODE_23_length_38171_cov_0.318108.p18 type:complete len:138 gc:universal NODE_23_length_38171_cov_0.318108:21489-21076(-)
MVQRKMDIGEYHESFIKQTCTRHGTLNKTRFDPCTQASKKKPSNYCICDKSARKQESSYMYHARAFNDLEAVTTPTKIQKCCRSYKISQHCRLRPKQAISFLAGMPAEAMGCWFYHLHSQETILFLFRVSTESDMLW